MLSAKGRVCTNKVLILNKMQTLRDRLQGYITEGQQKVQKRQADADAAKSAWLDSEAEYLMLKKKAEELDALVTADLKTVTSLASLLDLNKARLAKVRASVTEQLAEIDEEEAIIRELLGYLGDLTSSTVDVVRSSSRYPDHLPCFVPWLHHLSRFAGAARVLLGVPADPPPPSPVGQDITSLAQNFRAGVAKLMSRPVLSPNVDTLQAFAQ
jgi:hypothetical protein